MRIFFFWNTRCFRETCTELTIILYSCDYSGVNSFLKQYFFCIHIIFLYSYYFSCAGLVNYNLGVLGGGVIFWYLLITCTCKWIVCEVPIFVSKMKTLHFFQSAITHTNRNDKTQATFYWTPGQDLGHINFRFVLNCFKTHFDSHTMLIFWHLRYIFNFFQFPVPPLSRISISSGLTSHPLSYETLWTPSLAPAARPMETKITQERISRRIPCSQYSACWQLCSLLCSSFHDNCLCLVLFFRFYLLPT